MKYPIATLHALFITANLFGQSLTIKETLEYLNNVAFLDSSPKEDNYCQSHSYNKFDLTKEGYLVVDYLFEYTNCENPSRNRTKSFVVSKFHYSEVEPAYIAERPNGADILFPCKSGEHCVSTEQGSKNESFRFCLVSDITDSYNRKRITNAFNYLLELLQENNDYIRGDDNDPFSTKKIRKSKIEKTSPIANNKIKLKAENGIYTLLVEVNGINERFVLDSGAGEMNITPALEKRLIQAGKLNKLDYLTPGLYKIADGSIHSSKRVMLNIKVGDFIVHRVSASIGATESPLLLGKSFLDYFTSWKIENEGPNLVLTK